MAYNNYGAKPMVYNAPWQTNMQGGNLTVVDKVPQEMLYLVDAHWYQFPPMNPLWHVSSI